MNGTFTVEVVYNAIDKGDTFHTGAVAGGNYAEVVKFDCTSCGQPTLRTYADRNWNNDLDNPGSCR